MKFFATPTTANELFVNAEDSMPDSIVLMMGKDRFAVGDIESGKMRVFKKEDLEKIVKIQKEIEEKIFPMTIEIAEMLLRHEREKT